jgi:hypothetical protein
MSEDKDTHSLRTWLLWLSVALALYVFSVGPAVAIAVKFRSGAALRAIEIIYTPLIWLHANTFLRQPLEWYVNLWT